jgi:hypothetical protein
MEIDRSVEEGRWDDTRILTASLFRYKRRGAYVSVFGALVLFLAFYF